MSFIQLNELLFFVSMIPLFPLSRVWCVFLTYETTPTHRSDFFVWNGLNPAVFAKRRINLVDSETSPPSGDVSRGQLHSKLRLTQLCRRNRKLVALLIWNVICDSNIIDRLCAEQQIA